jgi:hypothetical protein
MSFLNALVVSITPRLVFGSKGEQEYFAISYEKRLLGSMVHLHVRRVGEVEKPLESRPFHSWLMADAPDWAREAVLHTNQNKGN